MRPFKLTWFILWAEKLGWSESYYLLATDREQALAQARRLRAARLACLIQSPTVLLAYERVAEITPPYLLHLERLNLQGLYPFPATQVAPWDGYQVTYRGSGRGTRPALMRGAPRGVGEQFDAKMPGNNWLDFWEVWLQALRDARACLQVADRNQRHPVVALQPDPTRQYRVLATAPAHGLPVGTTQLVSFAGLRAVPTLTWQHLVDVVSPDQVSIRGTNVGRISYPGGGYFTQVSYGYYPIQGAEIMRAGLRASHRAFRGGSWTTVDRAAAVGMHPCGLIMDVISNGYKVPMRMGRGQAPLDVRWFVPPDNTPVAPGWHAFGSLLWTGNYQLALDTGDIGEVPQSARPWVSGKPAANWGYKHTAGPDVYFIQGVGPVFASLPRNALGVPTACDAPPLTRGAFNTEHSLSFDVWRFT